MNTMTRRSVATLILVALLLQPLYTHAILGRILGIDSAVNKAVSGAAQDFQNGAEGFVSDKLGVDTNDLKFGIFDKKAFIPAVNVVLTNTENGLYTAFAQVSGITNPAEAYYTWYIKNDTYDRLNIPTPTGTPGDILPIADRFGTLGGHSIRHRGAAGDCNPETIFDTVDPAEKPNGENAITDLADDLGCGVTGTPDEKMEYYKISAMRAHIAAKYDIARYDSYSHGGNEDGVVVDSEYGGNEEIGANDEDFDEDGYLGHVGGDNAFNGSVSEESVARDGRYIIDRDNYCYIFDETTGKEFELVESEQETGATCMPDATKAQRTLNDHNGSNPLWRIGCVQQTTSRSLECRATDYFVEYEVDEVSTTTQTDDQTTVTADDGDPSTVDDATVVDSSETVTVTEEVPLITDNASRRDLYQCQIGESVQCAPPAEEDGDPIALCPGTGIPTCIPLTTPYSGDFTTSDLLDQFVERSQSCATLEHKNLLQQWDEVAGDLPNGGLVENCPICTDGDNTNTPECRAEQAQCFADNAAINAVSGQMDELRPLILAEYYGSMPYGLSEAEQITLINRLVFGIETTSDPSSFRCILRSDNAEEGGYDYAYTPEAINTFGFKEASCLPGLPNRPDLRSGELFPQPELTNRCTEQIHMWPGAPGSPLDDMDVATGLLGGSYTGDGKFTLAEEKFWGTNPTNAITVDGTDSDEALITGLGMQEFTWKYREGDEIGVVVEGIGVGTSKHDSQHPQTVFAFMEIGCKPREIDYYVERIRGDDIAIETADMGRDNIAECLLANFMTPGEVNESNNLDVSIDGPLEAIINGKGYSELFQANISRTEDVADDIEDLNAQALFNWQFYYADYNINDSIENLDPGEVDWGVPYLSYGPPGQTPGALYETKLEQMDLAQSRGSGLRSIEPRVNIYSDPTAGNPQPVGDGLLRVTVEVNVPTEQAGVTMYGRDEYIVRLIRQPDADLLIRRVEPLGAGVDIDKITDDHLTPICPSEDGDQALSDDDFLCPVIKNELLAFELPPDEGGYVPDAAFVSWDLDGERIACDVRASSLCLERPIVFVPAQRNGHIHTVTATVSEPDRKSGSNTYSRSFEIVAPTISFDPTSGSMTNVSPRVLGSYEEFLDSAEGVGGPELSSNSYVRAAGAENFTLGVSLDPPMLENYLGGDSATSLSINDRLTLEWKGAEPNTPIESTTALAHAYANPEIYNEPGREKDFSVEVQAIVSAPKPIRTLLYDKFGIPPSQTGPMTSIARATIHPADTSTQVYLSDEEYVAHVQQNVRNRGVTANIFSNSPAYVLFMLKITITIGVILFVSSLLMPGSRTLARRRY